MVRVKKPVDPNVPTSKPTVRKKKAEEPTDISSQRVVGTNTEDQIRARAYEIYLERQGNGGAPEDDWLRAEEELRRNRGKLSA